MNETKRIGCSDGAAASGISGCIRKWTSVGLLILTIGVAPTAKADLFCVQDASELTTALGISLVIGGSNEIRLRTGNYVMPGGYRNDVLSPFTGSLTISGGWNSGCSNQNFDPASTVIQGQGNAGSDWYLEALASVTVKNLTFLETGGLFLRSVTCQSSGQSYRVGRVRMIDSVEAEFNSASLAFDSRCHSVRAENNLIVGSEVDGIVYSCWGSSTIHLVNNTVRDVGRFAFLGQVISGDVCSSNSIGGNGLFNNILGDIRLIELTPRAHNNFYSSLSTSNGGGFFSGSADNLTGDPQLDGNYRPIEPGSPAINSGTDNVPGGLPATDIEGNSRIIGGIPDRGAYESSVVPAGSFVLTVTSNADSGAGTLRDILTQANGIAGLNLIEFDISGDCPRLITLASPLPNITEPVIINGFSQPGASVNTLDHGNNSVLCIGIRASQLVDVPYALRVPPDSAATLKVRGIGFGGYDAGGGLLGEAAIFLQGGSGHQIQGNQFSGAFHATTLPVSEEGVRLMNNATDALIGGTSPALRNTFSNSSLAAIQILGSVSGEHRIINNYIGTTPSGTSAAGNFDGIRIIQSGGNHVLDNLISGNTRDGVYISGESATGNLIGNNRIGDTRVSSFPFCGPSPLPPCPAPLTNRKGVFIDNDASNNTIGPTTFVGGPNRIRYSTQHGVRVLSGQRNRILNNSLFDNGTGANELDIDIDAFGLGAIDADCGATADGKANRGQNRPVIDTAEGNGTTLSVTGSLSSCTNSGGFTAVYRLQFFASSNCAANGHGPGQYFIGDYNVVLDGADDTDVTEPFSAELEHPWLSIGGKYITATTTDIFGNTSEFSQCIEAEVPDSLFADRFEQ
jgi:parallel beta-helix repeat protein